MHYDYKTCGTCSRAIHFDITDGRISGISFDGGCHGNLQGIAALAEGRMRQKWPPPSPAYDAATSRPRVPTSSHAQSPKHWPANSAHEAK